jgi:DNA polymerase III alpha subunit (gram-positive type)
MIDDLGQDLLRYNFKQKYVVFDFETNSLNLASPNINLPWNLGYGMFSGKRNVKNNEILLRWENYYISETVAKINGFDRQIYDKFSVEPTEPLLKFNEFLNREDIYSITANGFSFDIYVNNLALRKLNLRENFDYLRRLICIQNLFKADYLKVKLPKIGTDDWIAINFALTNYYEPKLKSSLGALCKKYEVQYDETKHHKAQYMM